MFENRTRERLTGAAILVAVIVLLVPELLSGPRRAALPALASIDEAPVRSYTLSLGDAQPSTAAAATDGTRADWPPANAATAHGADGLAAHRADGAARTAAAAPTAAAAGVAESSAADVSVKPVTGNAKPATTVPAAHATPHVVPHAAARTVAARSEGAAGEWAVQVGSFSSRENADRLARSLKLKGYGAFVSESPSRGREWFRVRVGPQRDRAAADSVAARLRAAGLRGAVAQPR